MKRLLTFSTAGLVAMALPALAMAQTTPPQSHPPTVPQNQPQQTMPQQTMPQNQPQQTMPQRNTPNSGAVQQQVATAHAHALMAQNAKSVTMAHTHLHHVINCLEGPSGNDFDGQAGDPCKGKGQGALQGTKMNSSMHRRLQQALREARSGLKSNELKAVQADASKVASLLQAPSSAGSMMK